MIQYYITKNKLTKSEYITQDDKIGTTHIIIDSRQNTMICKSYSRYTVQAKINNCLTSHIESDSAGQVAMSRVTTLRLGSRTHAPNKT